MLDKEKDLDSVNVSTPDHMHAPMAMCAMQPGLHVYGQKPLTHDHLRNAAADARRPARRSSSRRWAFRFTRTRFIVTAVALVQDGAIGKVKEVHTLEQQDSGATSARSPIGAIQFRPGSTGTSGWACAPRPFIGAAGIIPSNWRKRLDFGTGTFGDMGCHIYDPVFKAAGLDRADFRPLGRSGSERA